MTSLILPPGYHDQSPVNARNQSNFRDHFYTRLRAKYDAAQTSDENERHWANADFLSPGTALSSAVRRRVRSRARYEAQENNSHAKGMCLTMATDVVGTGPRIQLKTRNREGNQRVEKLLQKWFKAIKLRSLLTTAVMAETIDGAAWFAKTTNRKLPTEVKLSLRGFEDDFIESPYLGIGEDQHGVQFDADRNPSKYFVLKHHPGGSFGGAGIGNAGGDWQDATKYFHLYRVDRPGQQRGISHLHPALPLLAMLRRFTLATLAAAETAADFAAVMKTTASTVDPDPSPGGPLDAIPIEHRSMLTLPVGWDITQLKSEHPTTTYEMFERRIIGAYARCLLMPYNVAALDSSHHNYASGRLDDRGYWKYIGIKQCTLEEEVIEPLVREWYDEAAMIPGYLPGGMGPFSEWDYSFHWDQALHVDPQKEALASETRIRTGVSNRVREMNADGQDYETEDEIAAESYGVDVATYRAALLNAHFSNGNATQTQQGAPDAAQ